MNNITDKRIDKVKDCIQNSKTIVLAAFECIELCLAAIAMFLLLSVSYPEFVSFLLRPFSELSAISFAEFIESYGWIFGAGIKYILIAGLSLVIIHNSGCLLFIYTCRRGCKFTRHCHFALFFFLLVIWFATLCLAGYWLYWLIIGIIKSGFNYNIWQVIIFPLLSLALMLCYLWHSLFYHRDIVSIMKHLEKEIASGMQIPEKRYV